MRHIAQVFSTWQHKPRLVFLNGCQNKAQVTDLLAAGVGLVIATYKPIEDALAVQFAQEFYKNLLNTDSQTTFQLQQVETDLAKVQEQMQVLRCSVSRAFNG